MSAARMERIEAFIQAWNSQDVDAAIELIDEDFEYVNPPNAVEPGTRRGVDEARMVLDKQFEALGDGGRLDVERFHHREDHVIAEVRLSRAMPDSTARIEVQALLRWTFEGDRLVRLEVLGTGPTLGEALAEAGVT